MEEYKILFEHGNCSLIFSSKYCSLSSHVSFYQNRKIQIQGKNIFKNINKGKSIKDQQLQDQRFLIELSLEYLVSFDTYTQQSKDSTFQKDYFEIKFKNKITQQKFKLSFLLQKYDTLPDFVQDYFSGFVWLRNFNKKYEIKKQIEIQGKQRLFNIYLVTQKITKIDYWIKCYSKDSFYSDQNKTLQKIIANQINTQQKIQNSYSLCFSKFFQDNSYLYLIYQELPQITLKALLNELKDKQIQFAKIKVIIKSIFKILVCLKNSKIILGNIKPSNLVFINMDQSLQCKLIDFSHASQAQTEKTVANFVYEYGISAPELLKLKKSGNRMMSHKSDVFSVGIIFYTMLVGLKPFKTTQKQQFLKSSSFKGGYPAINFKDLPSSNVTMDSLDLLMKSLIYDQNERIQPEVALNHPFLKLKREEMTKSCTIRTTRKTKINLQKTNQPQIKEGSQIKEKLFLYFTSPCKSPSKFMVQSKLRRLKRNKNRIDGNIDSSDLEDSHQIIVPSTSSMKPSFQNKYKYSFYNHTA